MTKTYHKWRRELDATFKDAHRTNNVSWDKINHFCRLTGKVLNKRNFTEKELEMMWHRMFDPVVGITSAGPKMEKWYGTLGKISGVCVDVDGSLKACPDDPEAHGMYRLLSADQDSNLLLISILMLHENLYKRIVDFVYDYSGHNKLSKLQTKNRAEYLTKHGFDIMPGVDHFLRNAITHSTYRILDNGDVVVSDNKGEPFLASYDPQSKSSPPGIEYYTRQKLFDVFTKSQDFLVDALVGVAYWFHVNYGMYQLFDDRFFGSPERSYVVNAAVDEMIRAGRSNWKRILARFEKVLPS